MNEATPLTHRQTWDIIPWVVNGTATPDERAQVETHLRDCADCRDEYALQMQFHAGINAAGDIAYDPRPVLQGLLARIDAEEQQPEATAAPQRQRWMQWLAAAVVAQAVGLALLGGVILSRHGGAGYVTLSRTDASPGAAAIRFVPAPTLTLAAMQKLLADNGLRIIESNPGNAIFGLALADGADAASVDAVVAKLRQQPGVLLAEPAAGRTHAPH